MIGTVIISNSDDFQFLKQLIPEALKFSSYVSIAIGTKRWNGEPENIDKINRFILDNQQENVLYSLYDPIEDTKFCSYSTMVTNKDMLPEAYARYIALCKIPNNEALEYVLYLDSDELIDGDKFKIWLDKGIYKLYDVMKLACYWYWRLPIYRAKGYLEDSIVFIKRTALTTNLIFHDNARTATYDECIGRKTRMVVDNKDGIPFVHHYSWVRTHKQMLNKVSSWGHRHESFIAKVNEEFAREFNGRDFLKNLNYDVVDNTFKIEMID
jgi:hypothetical protein